MATSTGVGAAGHGYDLVATTAAGSTVAQTARRRDEIISSKTEDRIGAVTLVGEVERDAI